jgi:hypothetical protein
MGVTLHTARYLIAARNAGVSFSRTLTLGRQWLCANPSQIDALLRDAGLPPQEFASGADRAWADAFFRAHGARVLDILDVSRYEGAGVIHDLNQPLPSTEARRYDFVFDGGVIEHVYHCSVAFQNCMRLTDRGGHLCICTVANNECGHGLFQFSPERFFRLFDRANGFELRSLVLEEQRPTGCRWYQVTDPAAIGARVCCINAHPLHLKALARKLTDEEPNVQQSDYLRAWQGKDGAGALSEIAWSDGTMTRRWKQWARARIPVPLRGWALGLYRRYFVTRLWNRRFYQPVTPDRLTFGP